MTVEELLDLLMDGESIEIWSTQDEQGELFDSADDVPESVKEADIGSINADNIHGECVICINVDLPHSTILEDPEDEEY